MRARPELSRGLALAVALLGSPGAVRADAAAVEAVGTGTAAPGLLERWWARLQRPETRAERTGFDAVLLPLLQLDPDAGLIYGLRAALVDRVPGPRQYRRTLDVTLRHSTRDRHDHQAFLDDRDVLGSGLRLTGQAQVLLVEDAGWYGVARAERLDDPRDPRFRFRLAEPRAQLVLGERDLSSPGFWGVGVGLAVVRTSRLEGTLLAGDRPRGFAGHEVPSVLLVCGHDGRDDDVIPSRGALVEAYARVGPAGPGFAALGGMLQVFGEPLPRLVLAGRLMAESLLGAPPFSELGRIGGSQSVRGLGGIFSQRGYAENRFVGAHKALSNAELRYYLPPLFHRLELVLGAFVDASLVADGARLETLPGRVRASGGLELAVAWKRFFVFRVDLAFSPEGRGVYSTARHMF